LFAFTFKTFFFVHIRCLPIKKAGTEKKEEIPIVLDLGKNICSMLQKCKTGDHFYCFDYLVFDPYLITNVTFIEKKNVLKIS